MRTRIKLCGITRAEDVLAAAELGVDAIGLVFYKPSPRCVSVETARALVRVVPPFITTVGLFMNASSDDVNEVLADVAIDCLQFHGTESAVYCESFGRPFIKSVAMMDEMNIQAYTTEFVNASGFLLDAVQAGEAGGKGRSFDWEKVPDDLTKQIILAGGLDAENVAAAIRRTNCYAVDVSSGVESEKGIKSIDKMRKFVQQVNSIK